MSSQPTTPENYHLKKALKLAFQAPPSETNDAIISAVTNALLAHIRLTTRLRVLTEEVKRLATQVDALADTAEGENMFQDTLES